MDTASRRGHPGVFSQASQWLTLAWPSAKATIAIWTKVMQEPTRVR